eukprot:6057055-Amphidinium_carterae.1
MLRCVGLDTIKAAGLASLPCILHHLGSKGRCVCARSLNGRVSMVSRQCDTVKTADSTTISFHAIPTQVQT